MSDDVVDPRRLPTWAELNVRLNAFLTERDGEWCGYPLPLPGCGLVLEDKHPYAATLAELQQIVDSDRPPTVRVCHSDDLGWIEVNRWHGRTKNGLVGDIFIARHEDGRTTWGVRPDAPTRNQMLFGPLETMDAWHLDTELAAIDRLATLLTHRMFVAYVLTGSFLWSSPRSGVTYFFRRCRPTIAISFRPGRRAAFAEAAADDPGSRILCCLCLHPVGYYAGTFGGAMCPTDDVIAHYLLASADEKMFWRRAQQHAPSAPESGL